MRSSHISRDDFACRFMTLKVRIWQILKYVMWNLSLNDHSILINAQVIDKIIIFIEMQIVIAILFWIVELLNQIIISTFRNDRFLQRISFWVSEHHETCVWTQLILVFIICLADFIRQNQQQKFIEMYESSSILSLISVSFLSLVLTTASFFLKQRIDNTRLKVNNSTFEKRISFFYVCFFLIFVFALFAVFTSFWDVKIENLLQHCADFVDRENESWKIDAITSMHEADMRKTIIEIVLITTSTLLIFIFWFLLRRLRRSDDQVIFSRRRRILIILISRLSIFLIYEALHLFRDMLEKRQSMNLLWEDQIDQNVWDIEQIVALFSWVPLIVDMIYDVVNTN
jgi:hypothetical protein